MTAEFHITFSDAEWITDRQMEIIDRLESLPTLVKREGSEIWLRGKETDGAGRRSYDVRIFIQPGKRPLLEVNSHPESIESDLKTFMAWLRSRTPVKVLDEDGEESSW
jgi:hypothetical protein